MLVKCIQENFIKCECVTNLRRAIQKNVRWCRNTNDVVDVVVIDVNGRWKPSAVKIKRIERDDDRFAYATLHRHRQHHWQPFHFVNSFCLCCSSPAVRLIIIHQFEHCTIFRCFKTLWDNDATKKKTYRIHIPICLILYFVPPDFFPFLFCFVGFFSLSRKVFVLKSADYNAHNAAPYMCDQSALNSICRKKDEHGRDARN